MDSCYLHVCYTPTLKLYTQYFKKRNDEIDVYNRDIFC